MKALSLSEKHRTPCGIGDTVETTRQLLGSFGVDLEIGEINAERQPNLLPGVLHAESLGAMEELAAIRSISVLWIHYVGTTWRRRPSGLNAWKATGRIPIVLNVHEPGLLPGKQPFYTRTLVKRLKGVFDTVNVRRAVSFIRPSLITTTNALYREIIMQATRRHVEVCPLVPSLSPPPGTVLERRPRTPGRLNILFLGSITASDWDVSGTMRTLGVALAERDLRATLRVGGRARSEEREILIRAARSAGLEVVELGELAREQISMEMLSSDVLLSPTPIFFVRKSSILLSSRAHGLPVLLSRTDTRMGQETPVPGVIPFDVSGRWIERLDEAASAAWYDPASAAQTTARFLQSVAAGRPYSAPIL